MPPPRKVRDSALIGAGGVGRRQFRRWSLARGSRRPRSLAVFRWQCIQFISV